MQNYKLWYDVNENIMRSAKTLSDSFKAIKLSGLDNIEKDDQFAILIHIEEN